MVRTSAAARAAVARGPPVAERRRDRRLERRGNRRRPRAADADLHRDAGDSPGPRSAAHDNPRAIGLRDPADDRPARLLGDGFGRPFTVTRQFLLPYRPSVFTPFFASFSAFRPFRLASFSEGLC